MTSSGKVLICRCFSFRRNTPDNKECTFVSNLRSYPDPVHSCQRIGHFCLAAVRSFMPSNVLHFDTSVLPIDALTLCDDVFYELFGIMAGPGEAKLLQAQGIRSFYSFLSTEDVLAILSIPCQALRNARSMVCLEADDKTFIVKPGCRSNIAYLCQLLRQKHEEHMKKIGSKSKRTKHSQSQSNSHPNDGFSQSSVQRVASPSSHDAHTTTFGTFSHWLRP